MLACFPSLPPFLPSFLPCSLLPLFPCFSSFLTASSFLLSLLFSFLHFFPPTNSHPARSPQQNTGAARSESLRGGGLPRLRLCPPPSVRGDNDQRRRAGSRAACAPCGRWTDAPAPPATRDITGGASPVGASRSPSPPRERYARHSQFPRSPSPSLDGCRRCDGQVGLAGARGGLSAMHASDPFFVYARESRQILALRTAAHDRPTPAGPGVCPPPPVRMHVLWFSSRSRAAIT